MPSDEALYEQLIEGDLRAFDQLYARYERPLFGFIRRHLADAQEAEDVLHETFLALLRQSEARRAAYSFRAWVFQIARNGCLNRLRSRQRSARALAAVSRASTEPALEPERALEEREVCEALRQAVARLPSGLGELYQLRTGGMSYQELAEVLGVPIGTIKSRIHEMVARLRQEMPR